MKTDITFTKEGLTQAFKLHYNINYPVKSRAMLLMGALLLLVSLLMMFLNWVPQLPFLKYLLLLIGFAYIGLYFFRRKQLFERASAQKTFQGNFYFEVNSKGIHFGKANKVSRCAWQDITQIIEDQYNILFYFGKDKFYILPLKDISAEQKKMVEQTINKTKIEHQKT